MTGIFVNIVGCIPRVNVVDLCLSAMHEGGLQSLHIAHELHRALAGT